MKYEVCRIAGYGYLSDYQIEDKLNEGWVSIGVIVNGANEVIMYFQRVKKSK